MRISTIMKLWAALVFLILCITSSLGSYYCKNDDDCKRFGELTCVKSQCDWGVCSCKPRTAARLNGDWGKFKCVPVKKIGESCSPDGKKGLCGAPNSVCNSKNKCECKATYTPGSGMEMCFAQNSRAKGEYCLSNVGDCKSDGGINTVIGKATPPHAACAAKQHLVLKNTFTTTNFFASTYPDCKKNVVGSPCVEDADCGNIKERNAAGTGDDISGECDATTKKCKCKNTLLVPDSDGTYCGEALAHGDDCATPVGDPLPLTPRKERKVCDATKGLVCGDPCKTSFLANKRCHCAVTHKTVGTTCTVRKEGDDCFGDLNCKGISPTAVCVDKKCKAVSPFQTTDDGVDSRRPQLVIITLGILIALKWTL